MMHAMRDDLGVGFRRERVTQPLKIGAQLFVIFDDAVVHDRQAIVRHVRMRIAFRGHAMRRPAGVRDADIAVRVIGVDGVLEDLDLADGAQPLQLLRAIENRDAG
jgi:hypothetical protein